MGMTSDGGRGRIVPYRSQRRWNFQQRRRICAVKKVVAVRSVCWTAFHVATIAVNADAHALAHFGVVIFTATQSDAIGIEPSHLLFGLFSYFMVQIVFGKKDPGIGIANR